MRVIIQRVLEASIKVEKNEIGKIEQGLLVFVGVEDNDNDNDIEWICQKIVNMRIFNDDGKKMNHSIIEVKGKILLVSQFTLQASTKKGNRPSFIKAAPANYAKQCYEKMKKILEELLNQKIECGKFGADMKINLVNDGPVTIFIDSKIKE
ncbi:MAG: D-aminoacyl-tRNA deacylase [Chitinophagaceae bacterium]